MHIYNRICTELPSVLFHGLQAASCRCWVRQQILYGPLCILWILNATHFFILEKTLPSGSTLFLKALYIYFCFHYHRNHFPVYIHARCGNSCLPLFFFFLRHNISWTHSCSTVSNNVFLTYLAMNPHPPLFLISESSWLTVIELPLLC